MRCRQRPGGGSNGTPHAPGMSRKGGSDTACGTGKRGSGDNPPDDALRTAAYRIASPSPLARKALSSARRSAGAAWDASIEAGGVAAAAGLRGLVVMRLAYSCFAMRAPSAPRVGQAQSRPDQNQGFSPMNNICATNDFAASDRGPGTALTGLLAAGAGLSVASIYYSQPLLGVVGADLHASPWLVGWIPTATIRTSAVRCSARRPRCRCCSIRPRLNAPSSSPAATS